jgi:excinuclease ABC subunit C
MNSQDFKKIHSPDTPGVYLFKKGKTILYIGKATSLKDRVKSYFAKDLIATRGPLLVDMVFQADKIDFEKTDSVIEALILEASLIKKNQPRYNTKEKDDKSYNYVVITKEEFPRVLIIRGRELAGGQRSNLENSKRFNLGEPAGLGFKIKDKFGPFTNGTQLKEAIKIVRKIFPFRDYCASYLEAKLPSNKRGCFNYQIGLCAGTCIGAISKKEYRNTIRNIGLFFSGKKKNILSSLEKEMKLLAKNHEFEKADLIKKKIFALNHIQDIALIKNENKEYSDILKNTRISGGVFRIEAYDVAHISGTSTVGVMVVMENGEVNKNEYRKFIIKESSQNDTEGLREILERRFKHTEWRFPDIIVVDGSTAQVNIAKKVVNEYKNQLGSFASKLDIVAVTKDERHRPERIQGQGTVIEKYKKDILLANSEAHRFAIGFHRKKRAKRSLL